MGILKHGFLSCSTHKNTYNFYVNNGFLQDSLGHFSINPKSSLFVAEMLTECKWTPYKSYIDMHVTIKELPCNDNIVNDFDTITTNCYLRHTVDAQESVYLLKENELFSVDDLKKPAKLTELMFLDGKWSIVK
jgi:hypothetical protein